MDKTSASAALRGDTDEYSINTGEFHVDVSPAPENIAVCIRVRPLTEREERQGDVSVLRTVPKLQLISVTDAQGAPLPGKSNVFQYDHIVDASSSTADMYGRVARRIVRSTLEGINGTIFAYGQTSSGKTYTMQGPLAASERAHQAMDLSASPGLLQLAVDDIFQYIKQCEDRDFLLRVSFVEIYNEVVRDLLGVSADKDKDKDKDAGALKLREDPRRGVYVECHEEIITDFESILDLLHAGNQRRAVGQTAMNERSSRSHSIFRIVVESKRKASAACKSAAAASDSHATAAGASAAGARRRSDEDVNGAVLVASLSFVDLAGSESLRHTAAEGIRQREASNINKSLLTLSRVINSLASAGDPASQNAPFRDSKLTRLLQNSLGGNTRTLIVCCVTPAERYLEETKSTLQFAARAKSIQISATVNEVLDDQAQLRQLKREVHALKKLVHSERDQYKAEIDDHKGKIDHLKGLILSSASMANRAAADKQLLADGRPRARDKRSRETWCPGDFPSSFKTRRLDESDASPLSFRRLSADSRRSRLSSDMEDVHESDARPLPGPARSSPQSDAVFQTHRLWMQLLTQSLAHPDAEKTAGLWKSAALASGADNSDAVVELQSALRSVVSASQAATRSEDERPQGQELEGQSESTGRRVATPADEELTRQLEEAKRSLERERERYQALVEEKELADEAAATERDDLMQHLHALQGTVADKEARWEAETQRMQSALDEAQAQVDEFRARVSRAAGGDAASAIQELAKVKRQAKKAQMELSRARDEQQRREELHQEALADVEAAAKASAEEYAQHLEDAFAEVEALKLLKTQVAEQLEAAFDDKAAELAAQLEQAREATRVLEQELAAMKTKEALAPETSPELERVVAERQTLADAKAGLEEQLERMVTRHGRLETQIKNMDGDNSELQESVEELQCRVDALLKENARLQERPPVAPGMQDVSGELQEVLEELVQLRATIDSAEKDKEALADQNERMAGELGGCKALLVEMEHQVKVLHAQLDAKVMTISQLSDRHAAQVAALEQEVERLTMQQHDVRRVSGDAGGLQEEVRALKERNAQFAETVALALQEAQQASEERKQRQEEAAEVKREAQVVMAAKQALEEEVRATKLQLQQAEGERRWLKEEVAVLERRIHEREEKPSAPSDGEYAGFKEESEADVPPTQVEAVESEEDWKLPVHSHGGELADALAASNGDSLAALKTMTVGLRHQLQDMQLPEAVDAKRAFELLQQLKRAAESTVASLERVVEAASEQRAETSEELRALEAQLMLESQEKMRLVVAADEQRAQLREAEARLAGALASQQAAAEAAEAEAAVKASDASDAAVKVTEVSERPVGGEEELRRQLEMQIQARRTLELDVQSYAEALALLRREATDSSHAKAALADKLQAMEGELAAAAARQQREEKELRRRATALERAEEEKAELQRQMKQRLVAAETRELALEERIERLTRGGEGIPPERAADLQTQADAAKQAVAQLEQQLAEAQDALEAKDRQLLQQEDLLSALKERLGSSVAAWEAQAKGDKEAIDALEQQLTDMRDAREEKEQQLQRQQDELHELTERQARAEAAERELHAQVEALEARLREQEASQLEQLELHRRSANEELSALRQELLEARAASEELEQRQKDVTRGRKELEELRGALRASELEAREYHGQLSEAQAALERAEERLAAQRARLDKLEKVKMTNETLEVFRKLKSDRAALRQQLQQLQESHANGTAAAATAAAPPRELVELRDALRAEKQRGADLRAALQDERDKSAGEMEAMQEVLRAKVAAAEALRQRVEQLEQQQQPGAASALERANLELQFEVRKLRARLGDDQEKRDAEARVDKENNALGSDGRAGDQRSMIDTVRHPAVPRSVRELQREVAEKEQDASVQCKQQ